MPLVVVRHAQAGRRSAYKGDDRLRPLTERGRARAEALVPLLSVYRPQRILSSPFVRCCETVQPVAEALGLGVESLDELAEGHGSEAVRLMQTMAGESAVLCTHGDVATALLEDLEGQSAPAPAGRSTLRLQKGEFWVIQSTGTSLAIVEHVKKLATPSGASGPSGPSGPTKNG
jgi:broad specificity phosphatase PhoE